MDAKQQKHMEQRRAERMERLYPGYMASLRRQKATHERAVARNAALVGQEKPITNKRAAALRVIAQRAAERRARRAKYAKKV